MNEKFYKDPLRDRPCWECPKNEVCQGTCEQWESWFRRAWREIRAQFQMIRLRENMR